jgi:hypothetical protein
MVGVRHFWWFVIVKNKHDRWKKSNSRVNEHLVVISQFRKQCKTKGFLKSRHYQNAYIVYTPLRGEFALYSATLLLVIRQMYNWLLISDKLYALTE